MTSVGVLGWVRRNLFSSPLNTGLTLLALYLLYIVLVPAIEWGLIRADWIGSTRADCDSGGACWVFIGTRLNQFVYGFYPGPQQWRVNLAFGLLAVLMIPMLSQRFRWKGWLGALLSVIYLFIAYVLLVGGHCGLAPVPTDKWGGLMLTLVIAAIGMAAALPLGVLLALGRRSKKMPVVKSLCVVFIELWRGAPLITVLFMSSVMLPLFLPEGVNFDKLLRALIGVMLFEAAYMAEVVRGGLQGVPKGQREAADALGLSYFKTMGLVILPQALKLVIPGIVNTFIALFKDTSLVLIIGLFDLLGAVQNAVKDVAWGHVAIEGYVFAALIYWIFCFGMSRYSQRLERRLRTGHEH